MQVPMKQCHTKGRENSRELFVLPPLLGERAGVRASVCSNLIFGGSDFVNNERTYVRCYKVFWRDIKSLLSQLEF